MRVSEPRKGGDDFLLKRAGRKKWFWRGVVSEGVESRDLRGMQETAAGININSWLSLEVVTFLDLCDCRQKNDRGGSTPSHASK